MVNFNIGEREVGENQPCFIVAEAGINHNGDFELAKKLVDVAADAKADAVKFQLIEAKGLYVKDAGKFLTDFGDEVDIYKIWEQTEMAPSWINKLADYCAEKNIIFLSSVFEEKGVDVLNDYVDAFKIASYELTHIPLLIKATKTMKPIIMSIGGAEIDEVREAIKIVKSQGSNKILIMQCVAKYPMPVSSANVNVIKTLKLEFPDIIVGYSDHSLEPSVVPISAVAMGAKIYEKHFTLDRNMEGIDHKMSLEPSELNEMVSSIRDTEEKLANNGKIIIDESTLGDGEIKLTDEQKDLMKFTRRSIFAIKSIKKGDELSYHNIAVLRPGNRDTQGGFHPREFLSLIGKKAETDIDSLSLIKNEQITF